jgi:hypothetical protein
MFLTLARASYCFRSNSAFFCLSALSLAVALESGLRELPKAFLLTMLTFEASSGLDNTMS